MKLQSGLPSAQAAHCAGLMSAQQNSQQAWIERHFGLALCCEVELMCRAFGSSCPAHAVQIVMSMDSLGCCFPPCKTREASFSLRIQHLKALMH